MWTKQVNLNKNWFLTFIFPNSITDNATASPKSQSIYTYFALTIEWAMYDAALTIERRLPSINRAACCRCASVATWVWCGAGSSVCA